MRIAGVVCEYNPFHTGHALQLHTLRKRGAEAIVCCMSGNFVQRGDFAVARKHVRAEAAVRGGADLVLELPLPWALSSAEGFAQGGIEVLSGTGLVDTVAFGSECADTERLRRVADCLLSDAFPAALKAELAGGVSFAVSRQRAAVTLCGADAAVLSSPNDILGVEYCKALRRCGSAMTPLALQRYSVVHDGGAQGDLASASHIRALLSAGEDGAPYLTAPMASLYDAERRAGRAPVLLQTAERAVLARLRTVPEGAFAGYDGGNEGLYHRVFRASRAAAGVEELLDAAKTKRYARARLRRLLLCAYLGLREADRPSHVPYLRVLAMNETGKRLLREMRHCAALPVVIKPAAARGLSPEAATLMEAEARATDLYVLAYPALSQSAGGSEWRANPVVIENEGLN